MSTNFDICNAALRKIGVVAIGQVASAEEVQTAEYALTRMLRSWQNRGYNLWAVSVGEVTLTTETSYTVTRAVEMQSVRFRRGTTDMPMRQMTRAEYDQLPVKTTIGTPTSWYYDKQALTGQLYIWPALAVAAGEILRTTYLREYTPGAQADIIATPPEWEDAIVYGLAARLMDDFGIMNQSVLGRAEEELRQALALDREGSVFFIGDGYDAF